jgi:hypothetical protein
MGNHDALNNPGVAEVHMPPKRQVQPRHGQSRERQG